MLKLFSTRAGRPEGAGGAAKRLLWIWGLLTTISLGIAVYILVFLLPERRAHALARRDYRVAETALKQGRPRAAETALFAALTAWPRYADAFSKLGDLYYVSAKPDLAIVAYQQLAATAPQYKHIYCRLAEAAAAAGESGFAQSSAERELRLDPNCVRALDSLAMLHMRDLRRQAAVEAEKAYRLAPTDVRAIITYSQVFSSDEPDRAVKLLLQAKKQAPNSSEIDYDLGYCYSRGSADPRASDLALQYLREGEALAPGQGGIHRELCRLLVQRGNLAAAEQEGQLAVQFDSHDSAAFFTYAGALARLGKRAQVEAVDKQFRRLNQAETSQRTLTGRYGDRPKDATAAHELASTDEILGQTEEAVRILENAISVNPKNLGLRRDLSALIRAGASP